MIKNSFFLLVFILLLVIGFSLAIRKPLWTDEIHTQIRTLNQPYAVLLLGHYTSENSLAPLFYILQKTLNDVLYLKPPKEWANYHAVHGFSFSNVFPRILPILWMSLSFLLLLVYFSYRFNLLFGILGLIIALSSPILWSYWAEARPYGLWVLLTTCQMLLFLEILEKNPLAPKKWLLLSIVHLALSLTSFLSLIQIIIISLLLLLKDRRWHQYVFLLIVPLCIIFYYKPYLTQVSLGFSIPQLFSSTISLDRLNILFLYPAALGIYFLQTKETIPKVFFDNALLKIFPLFIAIFLIILTTFVFLVYLQALANQTGQCVMPRHIIFLAPVGIVGVTYLAGLFWESFKNNFWLKISSFCIILLFLFPA